MAVMTSVTNSANLSTYYFRRLLGVLYHKLQLFPLGMKASLPKGEGKSVKWTRYSRLSAATSALSEGVVPAEGSITSQNISATVAQYGNFVKISDLLELTAIDPVLQSAMDILGKQASLTIDTLCRNELDDNLPNQFANSKSTLATTGSSDVMNSKEILKGVITLKKDIVGPHSGNDYVCVVHPASLGDIMNDTNVGSWVDLNKYIDPSSQRPFNGEAGKVFGCRIMESHNISSTSSGTLSSATVYSNLLLGEEPFGVVTLDGRSVQSFIKPQGSAGSLDPINQIATAGWKAVGFVAKYLGGSANGTADRGLRIRAGSAF